MKNEALKHPELTAISPPIAPEKKRFTIPSLSEYYQEKFNQGLSDSFVNLSSIEIKVLKLSFGLTSNHTAVPLEKIGADEGIGRKHIAEIQDSAVCKLAENEKVSALTLRYRSDKQVKEIFQEQNLSKAAMLLDAISAKIPMDDKTVPPETKRIKKPYSNTRFLPELKNLFDGKNEEEQKEILSILSKKQAEAITLHLGLLGNDPRTENETANELGITHSSVSRREKDALKVLKEDLYPPLKDKLETIDEIARKSFMEDCSSLELQLIDARLGLNGEEPLSRSETAKEINVHVRRIARIENALIKKLTKPETKPKKARAPIYAPLFADKKQVMKHLNKLDKEERMIVSLRLGLEGEKPVYQSRIAEAIGKSYVYVSKKEKAIFEKLKTANNKKERITMGEETVIFSAESAA